jgi:hypothetical protein
MAKYILVYTLGGYPEEGGGTYTQEFGMEERKMHEEVEELVKTHKNNLTIVYAGFLQTEYKYEAIEYAIRVEPKRV